MSSLDMHHLGLPNEIMSLATTFPLGVSERPTAHSQYLLFQFIPRRDRADELRRLYYICSSWMCVL
jgi:hypothetical protein